MKHLLLVLGMLVLAVNVQAGVINVPGDFGTIQEGIDASVNGDTVLVAPGTYTENVSFGTKDIVLSSSGGPEETFLHPDDTDLPIVLINDTIVRQGTVHGFTFEDATHIALDVYKAGVMIRGNVFKNIHTNTDGGAINLDVSYYSRVDSNVFYDISARKGAAIRISNCRLDTIAYNLVYNVSGISNFHTYGCYGIFFHNNTLVDGSGNGIDNTYSTLPDIRTHNIVTGFVNGSGLGFSQINGYTVDYNCLFNNNNNYSNASYAGANDIAVDPVFVNLLFGNYYLTSISPCIDAGDPDVFFNDPDGSRNDIGAYHTDPSFPGLRDINFGPEANGIIVYLLPPKFFWTYYDDVPGTQSAYEAEVGSDDDWTVAEIWSSGTVNSSDEFVVYGGPSLTRGQTYYLRIRVNNGSAWSEWVEGYFYVSPSVIIKIPGAVSTIQAGIDLASNGDTVLVAKGTYSGPGNRDLDFGGKLITVLSVDGLDSTIIDCEGTELDPHRGFIFTNGENSSAIVDGFKIINGYAPQEGGVHRGGAVYCENSSPNIRYCKFDQCHAEQGGAVYASNCQSEFYYCLYTNITTDAEGTFYCNASDITLNINVFENNTAGLGGGVYALNSDLNLTDVRFEQNYADSGGGLYSENATLDYYSCEFIENSAIDGGGIYSSGLSSSLAECNFDLNSADNGGAIYFNNVLSTLNQEAFENNSANISGGALYLNESSPQFLNCEFEGNSSAIAGGAIYGFMSYPDFTDVMIYGNSSHDGGALYFDGGLDTGGTKFASDTVQISNCSFSTNLADTLTNGAGGAIYWQWDDVRLVVEECTFSYNHAISGGGMAVGGYMDFYMRNCTVANNYADEGAAMYVNPQDFIGVIDNSIMVYNNNGAAISCDIGTDLTLNCCDIFGNAGGDYTGCIASQETINDNFSLDPVFCEESYYLVTALSPCTPDNSPCGTLVGAYEANCYNVRCGDANRDTKVSVSDAVYIINYVFSGGNAPYPYASGDCNCDLKVNVSDAVYLIVYVFSGGPTPCDPDGDGQRDC